MSGVRRSPRPRSLAVARNVRQFRKLRGLTQAELASRLEDGGFPCDANLVHRIEHARRVVSVDELVLLAEALGVDDPWSMATLAECPRCLGAPPPGFICSSCGAGGGDS